jgi:hypothetical protein
VIKKKRRWIFGNTEQYFSRWHSFIRLSENVSKQALPVAPARPIPYNGSG